MRTTIQSSAIAAAGFSLLAACGGGTVPRQVLTKPAVAPAPAIRTVTAWVFKPSAARQSFVIDQDGVLTIRADSSEYSEPTSTHAEVSVTTSPATDGVSGTVSVFLVKGSDDKSATPAGVTTPFEIRAEYSAHAAQLDFLTPREVAPCASGALSASQSLRDLWFRAPDTLRVGTTWQDSASYVICRDGIPLHAIVHREFRVLGAGDFGGDVRASISRTSRTEIDGVGSQFGEPVTVNGSGTGQLTYALDLTSGEILSATGMSSLEVALRGRLRTQRVRQIVQTRITRP